MAEKTTLFVVPVVLLGLCCAGCVPEQVDLSDHKFNTKALDVYMGDAPDPVRYQSTAAMTAPVRQDGIYGDWTATFDMKKAMDEAKAKAAANRKPSDNPQMEEFSEKFADALASAFSQVLKADLKIEKDGTFTMMFAFMPIEGKWTRDGDRLKLDPETFMGMTAEEFNKQAEDGQKVHKEPMVLEVAADNSWLKVVPTEGNKEEMVFRRP